MCSSDLDLAHDVEILKIRTTPLQDKPTKSLNALSIQIYYILKVHDGLTRSERIMLENTVKKQNI